MCVLRANGSHFDVDLFLIKSSIEPCKVYRKGERRFPTTQPDGPMQLSSGFNAQVSTRDWDDLKGQIEDAKAFLDSHRAELGRLRCFAGVEGIEIDFAIPLRIGRNNVAIQSDRFPADLILAAGLLGISLSFTIWPPPPEAEESLVLC
jgi:hypothetical protein